MAALSDYLETALLNAVLRNTAYTSPTTVYVALFTTNPTDANTGTEVSGGGYARKAATFGAPSGGATDNTGTISWTASGAGYGTVTHFGIYDALTVGNLLFHGALAASKTVADGDSIEFAIGDLDVSLD